MPGFHLWLRAGAIAEQIYCFQGSDSFNLKKWDNLFLIRQPSTVHILRTRKNNQEDEAIEKQKIISNLSLKNREGRLAFNVFNLKQEKYIFFGFEYLEEEVERDNRNPVALLICMEIDSNLFPLPVVQGQVNWSIIAFSSKARSLGLLKKGMKGKNRPITMQK